MSLKANEQSAASPTVFEPSFQAITQGTVQNVAYTGTAARSSAFGAATSIIRLVASSDCYFLIATGSPTATTSNGTFLPSGAIEYFGVTPGFKVSAIQSSAAGTLNITEGAG